MGRRICDNCGMGKDVFGGKTCPNGHFICQGCARTRTTCPLCGKPLR